MKNALLFILPILSFTAPHADGKPVPMIVSTQWLSENLTDRDLVVLHVASTRREYLNGHIPGARFLWTGWFAQSNPELSYEVVSDEQLTQAIRDLGLTKDSRIVLCFTRGAVSTTTRMYVTLVYAGLGDRISILDGGFDAWKSENRPVSKDETTARKSDFTPVFQRDAFATVNAVQAARKDPRSTVVDARSRNFYDGAPSGSARQGHILGAVNLPFSSVVDSTNRFLSRDSLRTLFTTSGIPAGNKIITYCHIGQQATLVYFVARYLGHEASVFDGSFEDWAAREELPVEMTPEKKTP